MCVCVCVCVHMVFADLSCNGVPVTQFYSAANHVIVECYDSK